MKIDLEFYVCLYRYFVFTIMYNCYKVFIYYKMFLSGIFRVFHIISRTNINVCFVDVGGYWHIYYNVYIYIYDET